MRSEVISSKVAYSKTSGNYVYISLDILNPVTSEMSYIEIKLDNLRSHLLLGELAQAVGINEQIKQRKLKNED